MKLQFSIGLTSNPRTWPIIDGKIVADAIDLIPTVLHPSELFWRQLRFGEFDVSEMSLSSLMMAKAKGDDRFVGIPVFTTRRFFHTGILVRKDASIDAPGDLKGKRVGVPEYQQTAALWARGVLQHEFGVLAEGDGILDGAAAVAQPRRRHRIRAAAGRDRQPDSGREEHRLDDAVRRARRRAVLSGRSQPDRSQHRDLHRHPAIKPLFPDPLAEGIRFYRKTGLYPINHGMVIKRELAEQHPWAILNILKAFHRANELAERQRIEHAEYHIEAGLLPAEARKALHAPIIRHGVVANRLVLETVAQYSLEQGLTPRLMQLDELFAASTMEQ